MQITLVQMVMDIRSRVIPNQLQPQDQQLLDLVQTIEPSEADIARIKQIHSTL